MTSLLNNKRDTIAKIIKSYDVISVLPQAKVNQISISKDFDTNLLLNIVYINILFSILL